MLCIVNPPGSQSGSIDSFMTGGVSTISSIMRLMMTQMTSLAEGPGMTLCDNGCLVLITATSSKSLININFCYKERVMGGWEIRQRSKPTYLQSLVHEFEEAVKQDGQINLQREGQICWFLSVRLGDS